MTQNPHHMPLSPAQETWPIFRIMPEFGEGFEAIVQCEPAVSVVGSARSNGS